MNILQDRNKRLITEFILVGFPYFHGYQPLLFVVLLVIYLEILIGNTVILTVIVMDAKLHKPMYFFLGNLTVLDLTLTTTTIPKMLALVLFNDSTISFMACFIQMCLLDTLGNFECFLLLVMAYDRYIAICNPLHYTSIMNQKFNIQITTGSFVAACIVNVSISVFTAQLPFYGPNKISHCFCDHFFISRLTCADITSLTIWAMCIVFICVFTPFLLVVLSYINILKAVLKINSTAGRWKTFSTCSSHLIVVIIYYVSIIASYSLFTLGSDYDNIHALGTIFSSILAPALNPFIYALRNKDVQEALKMLIRHKRLMVRTIMG
ncbi:olfactory receptor 2AT4-like [Protopterus annectens]|uniref:olfactory receptor 2AT4-like n=1 Tax=Protopterus annectens TaxID=7888 RepID=UPI001CFAF78E|nr:olfactory receptor 2AT4-like [Protopterus annectens]